MPPRTGSRSARDWNLALWERARRLPKGTTPEAKIETFPVEDTKGDPARRSTSLRPAHDKISIATPAPRANHPLAPIRDWGVEAGLVTALEGAERFALPPPPAIASVGTQEPMVRRLFPGGNRIRTIGPASGKVVDAKFQRSDPGRRTLTLGGGAEYSLEGRDIELSVSPKDIRTSPYDLCANPSDRR